MKKKLTLNRETVRLLVHEPGLGTVAASYTATLRTYDHTCRTICAQPTNANSCYC
jgi:hypothetical protein